MAARTLGTLLRHLVELLDADVEAAYREAGLDYRPRYTPVMRALEEQEALSIKEIAEAGGLTHSAASQTVSHMTAAGLVESSTGADARVRMIRLTERGRGMLPALHRQWAATAKAADDLMAEVGVKLDGAALDAIEALRARSFLERIRAARGTRSGGSAQQS